MISNIGNTYFYSGGKWLGVKTSSDGALHHVGARIQIGYVTNYSPESSYFPSEYSDMGISRTWSQSSMTGNSSDSELLDSIL